jgi:hypothetical protein
MATIQEGQALRDRRPLHLLRLDALAATGRNDAASPCHRLRTLLPHELEGHVNSGRKPAYTGRPSDGLAYPFDSSQNAWYVAFGNVLVS